MPAAACSPWWPTPVSTVRAADGRPGSATLVPAVPGVKVALRSRGPVRLATFRTMSTAQRVGIIVLIIVGVVAAVFAFEYLTVAIHALPSWVPGKHHGRGHYHKRGAILAVIALACFGGAGYLIYRARSAGSTGDGAATPTATPTGTATGQDAGSLLTGGDEAPKE